MRQAGIRAVEIMGRNLTCQHKIDRINTVNNDQRKPKERQVHFA